MMAPSCILSSGPWQTHSASSPDGRHPNLLQTVPVCCLQLPTPLLLKKKSRPDVPGANHSVHVLTPCPESVATVLVVPARRTSMVSARSQATSHSNASDQRSR